jgi:ribosomal protein L32
MASKCGRTGCQKTAHHRCAKCGVTYCEEHLVASKTEAGVYYCPECDHYVRSLAAGRIAEGRQAPR